MLTRTQSMLGNGEVQTKATYIIAVQGPTQTARNSRWTWIFQIGELALKEIISELFHQIKISCKYRNKTKPGFIGEHFLKIGKGKHTHFGPANACGALCKKSKPLSELSLYHSKYIRRYSRTPPPGAVLRALSRRKTLWPNNESWDFFFNFMMVQFGRIYTLNFVCFQS